MSEIYEVAENIYLIDAESDFMHGLTAAYFIDEDRKALIDTGHSNSAAAILAGVKQIGVDPKEISLIIITHVHLDHAGGAGIFIKEMPHAKILVHPRGARHLIDPSRLMDSAMQVLSQEEIARYGLMSPIDRERVEVLEDSATIELSSQQRLKVIYTPGHANHHLCLYEERNKGLFAGDALCDCYTEAGFVLLPDTPAPSFDLTLALNSLERVKHLHLKILYLSHFGVSREVEEILRVAEEKLKVWGDVVYQAMKDNPDDVVGNLREFIYAELQPMQSDIVRRDIWFGWAAEAIEGYVDYFRKIGKA